MTARGGSFDFSTGLNGYVGTGIDAEDRTNFWKYDQIYIITINIKHKKIYIKEGNPIKVEILAVLSFGFVVVMLNFSSRCAH